MKADPPSDTSEFDWTPQPLAAAVVADLLEAFLGDCSAARELAERLSAETGTRLVDWIDHIAITERAELVARLSEAGFTSEVNGQRTVWSHAGAIFPTIVTRAKATRRLAIKVDSVSDFLTAQGVKEPIQIKGAPDAPLRMTHVLTDGDAELWAVVRQGFAGFDPPEFQIDQAQKVYDHLQAFRLRRREFDNDAAGFEHATTLIEKAVADLGVDRACDVFFIAERENWQSRNRAGRAQKARQDALGMGWANHDHHTYRSSREHYHRLIAQLELLGFECRERFYAGAEAGWGAQVLEQPVAGIVIFADVDMSAEELAGDFSHEGLPKRDSLGTIGLWCALHGEAFLQAGMHHLECQFDFDRAVEQLRGEGIETMEPFTDFPHLRQAFTEGEVWQVDPRRIEAALAEGLITVAEADTFRREGAIGSHLEILERNDGYRGFNQTGVSQIIAKTDPRSC